MSIESPSRAGALPFPTAVRIQMTLSAGSGSDVPFQLASTRPGIVMPGNPPSINLDGIRQQVLITIELVGSPDIHFPANPHDAAWFASGTTFPTTPGNGGGMFRPLATSHDHKELTFLAVNPGDGGTFRARFNFSSDLAVAVSGGPIIIND